MNKVKTEGPEVQVTRRVFLGFFLAGGFLSLFSKKIDAVVKHEPKRAMFWRMVK
ncbi:MAG: hypothetical protein HY754_02825 [Nitrospirae bacterium]|nr:hypothetical protein [Nitrospirota bacterium]